MKIQGLKYFFPKLCEEYVGGTWVVCMRARLDYALIAMICAFRVIILRARHAEASSVCINRAPVCINKRFMHTHLTRSPPIGVEKLSGVFMNDYLKPLDTFWTEQNFKVHRFTNNLQGLQKVMVKDFPWNIFPWNALLFEKTSKHLSILDIENNGFILNTCHDMAKCAETRVGFPIIFFRPRWPIELKFSQICYFIPRSCDTRSVGLWTILFTDVVRLLYH